MEKNSEIEEESAAKSRIFIGGLGQNVTENEIRNTFCKLGDVEGVDIYRTKGRSFAYIDFIPSSDKSLPKLFSTYNGCMWKGGRLKLEKAKEHYLFRLKREWEEDAKLAKSVQSNADVPQTKAPVEKPKKLQALEKPGLRIFFPKLSKMKSLPFNGSGKHKYSFQRIEVPSLPIHFCDCEEHCGSFDPKNGAPLDFEMADGVIKAEELNIMESVMKKLFQRETHSKGVPVGGKQTEEKDSSADPVYLSVNENELEPPSDDDDLIMNMVTGGDESIPLSWIHEQKTTNYNKERTYGKLVDSLHKSQRKKIEPYSNKRKLPLAEENDSSADPVHLPVNENESEPPSDDDNLIMNMVTGGDESIPLSCFQEQKTTNSNKERTYGKPVASLHESQRKKIEPHSNKRKLPLAEANKEKEIESISAKRKKSLEVTSKEQEDQSIKPKLHSKQATKNVSWSRKSAWKDLIGKKGDGPFQISNVTHRVPSKPEESPEIPHSMPSAPSAKVEHLQISHSIPSNSSAKEEPRSDDLNIETCNDTENKNILQHEQPESVTAHSKDQQGAEAPALSNDMTVKIARGSSWRQKSSWTQLVADANKNSFSITQVIPGLSFEKQEPPQPNGTNIATSLSKSEHQPSTKPNQVENTGPSLEATKESLHASNPDAGTLSKKSTVDSEHSTRSTVAGNREVTTLKPDTRQPPVRKPISASEFGETCSFMRSAESLKEWAKAKASLSNSLKKKKEVQGK